MKRFVMVLVFAGGMFVALAAASSCGGGTGSYGASYGYGYGYDHYYYNGSMPPGSYHGFYGRPY